MRNLGWIASLVLNGCFYAAQERVVVVHDADDPAVLEGPTHPDGIGTVGSTTTTPPKEDPCGHDPYVAPIADGPDDDGDGLSNALEDELGTLAAVPDTDQDGLDDGIETVVGTSPVRPDSDDDGLLDGAEVAACTDPLRGDSDGDGVGDGDEVLAGTDPLGSDSDGDGLSDGDEATVGTDPQSVDTDEDGLGDGDEVVLGTDPLNPDTDSDALNDGDELGAGTDPHNPDTDLDGIGDGDEIDGGTNPLLDDTDGDGIDDGPEGVVGSDPLNPDTDGDGIDDGDEVLGGSDPLGTDSDADGVDDGEETELGSDPTDADSDDDGVDDGAEVDQGSDPLDPQDSVGVADADEAGTADWTVHTVQACGCASAGPSGALLPVGLAGLGIALRRRRARAPIGRTAAIAAVATSAVASGCYYQEQTTMSGSDYIPQVIDAFARCYIETGVGEVWIFGAQVDDLDGADDVIAVQAEVYDEYADAQHSIATLDLERTYDATVWYTEMWTPSLDCDYPGYTVDFTAFDHLVSSDTITVWGEPYYGGY